MSQIRNLIFKEKAYKVWPVENIPDNYLLVAQVKFVHPDKGHELDPETFQLLHFEKGDWMDVVLNGEKRICGSILKIEGNTLTLRDTIDEKVVLVQDISLVFSYQKAADPWLQNMLEEIERMSKELPDGEAMTDISAILADATGRKGEAEKIIQKIYDFWKKN